MKSQLLRRLLLALPLLQATRCGVSGMDKDPLEGDLVSPVCTNQINHHDAENGCVSTESRREEEGSAAAAAADSEEEGAQYTANDDVSWAIKRTTLRHEYHQEQYDRFMTQCRQASSYCKSQENLRLYMNQEQPASVHNYTRTGFAKMRAPVSLWNLLLDFFHSNQGHEVVEHATKISPYHNSWETPPKILRLDNASLVHGGVVLKERISQLVQPILEQWTGQFLLPVSIYGIRIYGNRSILTPHVDRMPLVTSCIINVDQDVQETWPLEVFDHDGMAHNVSMQPGDMVLYESHSIVHGRPFAMKGRFFANVFLHFEPLGPLLLSSSSGTQQHVNDTTNNISNTGNNNKDSRQEHKTPPYILPGSKWEEEWKLDNPNGWNLLHMVMKAVESGDVRTVDWIAKAYPDAVSETDENGWAPIHQAVRYGHLEIVQVLLDHGVSPNQPTLGKQILLPLELALHLLGADHEVTRFLWTVTTI